MGTATVDAMNLSGVDLVRAFAGGPAGIMEFVARHHVLLLYGFISFQLAVNLLLVAALIRLARQRPRAASQRPPDWYPQFLALTREVLAATEPLLDALEARTSGGPATAVRGSANPEAPAREPVSHEGIAAQETPEPTSTDRRREAFALLRRGVPLEEVGERAGLLPGELRLIKNLLDAEARTGDRPAR